MQEARNMIPLLGNHFSKTFSSHEALSEEAVSKLHAICSKLLSSKSSVCILSPFLSLAILLIGQGVVVVS